MPQIFAFISALAIGVAYAYLAAVSVVLAVIDVQTHRLPNRIVLPSYPILLTLLAIAAGTAADWTALLRAVAGGVLLFVFYAVLRLLGRGAMGGGDVKLAGVLGLALGFVGWGALIVGAVAAFVLGGLYGLALVLVRRASRTTHIPFGPWMLFGAWVGIFVGERAMDAYVGLLF